MSGFEINLYSNRREFHTFATDDFALLEIGIGAYNISSIANFFSIKEDTFAQIKPMNPDTKEFFSNEDGKTIANKLIGENFLLNMRIMEFDIDTKKYKEVTGFSNILELDSIKFKPNRFTQPSEKNIKDFLQNWNKVQQGFISEPKIVNGYKAVAYKVQNSLSGCIIFDADLNILGNSRKSLIRLSLLDSANNSSERSMSFNGSPFISAVPRTAYGAEYSFNSYSQSRTGAYDKPEGSNSPTDAVAGKLATAYDPSTGEHVSGTQQMLVKLLDDIDTADMPELTVQELNALNREDFYDKGPDSPGFMGNFTTGKAIPLSAENGNPYMFGPDFRGGCSSDKKVQINLINRLNQNYKAGSVVVVSKMLGDNGNWTIVSPGTDTGTKKKISFENFEYQKYLIPVNKFFRRNFSENITPNNLISKIRNHYYASLIDNANILDDEQTYKVFCSDVNILIKLNILASELDYDEEEPATKLYNEYINPVSVSDITTAVEDKNIDKFELAHSQCIKMQDDISTSITYDKYLPNECLPKNVLRRSKNLYKIISYFSTHLSDDPTMGVADAPFWGIVFPEGYKADQCKKFYDKVKDTIILGQGRYGVAGDPNLSELSVKSNLCAPYFDDNIQSLLFLKSMSNNNIDTTSQGYPSDLIRKTGGIFTNYDPLFLVNGSIFENTKKYVEFNNNLESVIRFNNSHIFSEIYGLEPVNPSKLQFSPLSIEQIYATSELNNPGFNRIKESLARLNGSWSDAINKNFVDYLKENSIATTSQTYTADSSADVGNVYPTSALSFSNAFQGSTLDRHPAPVGVLRNGSTILPAVNNFPRSPVIPVLTCKSTISTGATSLLFTIDQYFGSVAKKTIAGGQGPTLTVLPVGAGVGFSIGGTPLAENSIPQWGDNTRTDNFDSMGTTALHVRIFEAWPCNQTIFLGHIFTPMHFNPSIIGNTKYEIENTSDGKIKLKSLSESSSRSDVDFQIPTNNNDTVISLGSIVTQDNLAPMTKWKWTGIRRAKLLNNGGFAYLKPVFAINGIPTIKNGGSGYKQDTMFTYPDGSSFKINVTNGKITSLKDFVSNYDSNTNILKDDSVGILSLDAKPIQSEVEGNGAVFEPQFRLVGKIALDKGPKELSTIKRLTKSSNMGEDSAEGVSTTVIDIEGSSSKKFDLFYFFHNDPTHYSLNGSEPFYRDLAQYVISEVKPA